MIRILSTDTHRFLAQWRTKHSFTSLVQFRHDDVLCLFSGGLRREIDQQWFVGVRQLLQKEVLWENRSSSKKMK